MSDKVKELSLEDLQQVTGGIGTRKNCPYFLQAMNKQAVKECDNCLYYNKVKAKYQCTRSSRDNKETSFI